MLTTLDLLSGANFLSQKTAANGSWALAAGHTYSRTDSPSISFPFPSIVHQRLSNFSNLQNSSSHPSISVRVSTPSLACLWPVYLSTHLLTTSHLPTPHLQGIVLLDLPCSFLPLSLYIYCSLYLQPPSSFSWVIRSHSSGQPSYCFFLEVLLEPRETGLGSLQYAVIIPCGYLFHSDYGNTL